MITISQQEENIVIKNNELVIFDGRPDEFSVNVNFLQDFIQDLGLIVMIDITNNQPANRISNHPEVDYMMDDWDYQFLARDEYFEGSVQKVKPWTSNYE
jgi:hypothetical protein